MREKCSPFYGCSLSRTLPELAMRCLYGDLASRVTIVMPCGSALVPVQPAAPQGELQQTACGPLDRRPCTESIAEHVGVVMGIDTDIGNAMNAVAGPLPVA